MRGCRIPLLLLLFSLLATGVSQAAEPAPREKVLQHLENLYRSASPDHNARRHIETLGTNAVPVLIEVLGYQPAQLHQWYEKAYAKAPESVQNEMSKVYAWGRLREEAESLLKGIPETPYHLKSIVPLMRDTRPEVRRSAAKIVQNFARNLTNKDLLPFLSGLKDEDQIVRGYMAGAFRDSGSVMLPEVVAALEAALNDPSEIGRLGIAATLLKVDGNHPGALQALRGMFGSTNAHSRFYAAMNYMNSNPPKGRVEDELLPIFMEALADPDQSRHWGACASIGRFGTRAKKAEPLLQKLLQSSELGIREAATNALRNIAPPAPASREKVLQHLAEVFGPPNQPSTVSERKAAIQSIEEMGTNAIPFLIEILGHRKSQADQWYELAYAKAPEAVRNSMSKPEALEKLRSEAYAVLSNMRDRPLYFTDILALLQDERVEVRQKTASVLYGFAERVNKVQLLECVPHLRDSDPQVRRYLVMILGFGVALPRVKAELEKTLADPDEGVRITVAAALLKADPDHPAALQTLRNLFTATNLNRRFGAARTYMNSNPYRENLEELLPIYLEALSGPDQNLHLSACYALRAYSVRAKTAVPVLLKHVQSQNPQLKEASRNALERIAPEVLPPVKP